MDQAVSLRARGARLVVVVAVVVAAALVVEYELQSLSISQHQKVTGLLGEKMELPMVTVVSIVQDRARSREIARRCVGGDARATWTATWRCVALSAVSSTWAQVQCAVSAMQMYASEAQVHHAWSWVRTA